MASPIDRRLSRDAEIKEGLRRIAHVPTPSLLVGHLQALADMPAEIAGVDLIEFTAIVSTAGSVSTAPISRQTKASMYSELVAVYGWMREPDTDTDAPGRITVQISDNEVSGNLWTTPIYLANLVGTRGGLLPINWGRGFRRFNPNTTIECTFSPDSSYAGAGISQEKRFGITLQFNLFKA